MSAPQTEFDSPWKDIIENYFQDFIRFFIPEAYSDIDWTRPPEFLNNELSQIVRDAELGRRFADKLVRIWLLDGASTWIIIHVEVQSQYETGFAERMFVYNYRIYNRYRGTIVSLAILGDEVKSWNPHEFGYGRWGTKMNFNFSVVKLLDYQKEWSALEVSRNPFATVVMAHLKAQETRDERSERKESKLALIRRLYDRGYSREEIINLFGFIDWVMSLPQDLEKEFWQEIQQLEESRRMKYVTSVERIARQEGRQEGLEQSQQLLKDVLLESIELGLELKFGSSGLALLSEISEIKNVEKLRAIQTGLKTVNILDELRQIYQSAG